MVCCWLCLGVRVALLPLGVRVPALALGMRVSLALAIARLALAGAWLPLAGAWLPLAGRACALPLRVRAALAIARLALAGARLPVAMPARCRPWPCDLAPALDFARDANCPGAAGLARAGPGCGADRASGAPKASWASRWIGAGSTPANAAVAAPLRRTAVVAAAATFVLSREVSPAVPRRARRRGTGTPALRPNAARARASPASSPGLGSALSAAKTSATGCSEGATSRFPASSAARSASVAADPSWSGDCGMFGISPCGTSVPVTALHPHRP